MTFTVSEHRLVSVAKQGYETTNKSASESRKQKETKMATYAPASEKKAFKAHKEGKFSAVLCDVYELVEPNYFAGKADRTTGEIDNRQTVRKLYLSFLTSETVEIKGEKKPAWIRQGYNFSLGENANLAKVLKAWIKDLRDADLYERFRKSPIDDLIGTSAFIEISHSPNRNDPANPYANVIGVAALPKFDPESGEPITPMVIPADYTRSDVKKLQDNADARIRERIPTWEQASKNTAAHTPNSAKGLQREAAGDDDYPF